MFFGDCDTDISEIIHVSDKRDTEIEYENLSQFTRIFLKAHNKIKANHR